MHDNIYYRITKNKIQTIYEPLLIELNYPVNNIQENIRYESPRFHGGFFINALNPTK